MIRVQLVLSLLLMAATARAEKGDARAHYQRATAHYAVGEFDEAAAEYQTAYKLKQDPALLFNAAQAYRFAGRLDKALVLYRNYAHLYPNASNIDDIKQQIAKLKQAIASATTPPTGTNRPADERPTATAVAPAPVVAPVPPAPAPAPVVAQAAPRAERPTPVYKKWWLWTIVGVVAAGGAVTTAVLLTQPSGSWENHSDIGPSSASGLTVQW